MPMKPALSATSAVVGAEAFADHFLQIGRRVGRELEPDHPAAPAALDRAAEVADQILGLLLDLDVAVADQPECAAPTFSKPGKSWSNWPRITVSIAM